MDISSFFPKYPEYTKYKIEDRVMHPDMKDFILDSKGNKIDILGNNNENFYDDIYHKKEFYDNRILDPVVHLDNSIKILDVNNLGINNIDEIIVDNQLSTTVKNGNILYKHQDIITKYMSSYTPYEGQLLFHHMGSGKSITALSVSEAIKSENYGFIGAVVIARSARLLENLKTELVKLEPSYAPSGFDKSKPMTQRMKIERTKLIKSFYEFETYQKLANKIKKMTKEEIRERYSNKVIIMDEIHNLTFELYDQNTMFKLLEIEEENINSSIEEKDKSIDSKDDSIEDNINSSIDSKYDSIENKNDSKDLNTENDETEIELDEDEDKKIDRKTMANMYVQMYRLTHNIDNKKILLLTGTPMRDNPTELGNIINLISDDRLNISDYIISDKDGKNEITDIGKLKGYLKGKISYYNTSQSTNFKKTYIGNSKLLKHTTVYESQIIKDTPQYEGYLHSIALDSKRSGVHNNKRRAALAIFPDNKVSLLIEELNQIENEEDKLSHLSNYSIKYATVIKEILKSRDSNKLSIVYSKLVNTSGIKAFASVLETFGFSPYSYKDTDLRTEKPRYLQLHGLSDERLKTALTYSNKPENLYGKYINVILYTSATSVGLSFKHVQDIHIMTPHWNFSEIEQAIARGLRIDSHNDLVEARKRRGEPPTIDVRIFLHTTTIDTDDKPGKERLSKKSGKDRKDKDRKEVEIGKTKFGKYIYDSRNIDLYMYSIAEDKDVIIKKFERVLKESAIDCRLLYANNISINGVEGSRECDYQECDYKCDGNHTDKPIDTSTYNLYYNKQTEQKIIDFLREYFSREYTINIETLINMFEDSWIVLYTVMKLVNSSTTFVNSFGIPNYIKEEDDLLYLTSDYNAIDSFSSEYTNRLISRKVEDKMTIDNLYKLQTIEFVNNNIIDSDLSIGQRLKAMDLLDESLQETILETIIERRNENEKSEYCNRIIQKYINLGLLKETDKLYISSILGPKNLRCYTKGAFKQKLDSQSNLDEKESSSTLDEKVSNIGKWTKCDSAMMEEIKEKKTKTIKEMNKQPFYGLMETKKGNKPVFKIRTNKKSTNTGERCETLAKDILISIIMNGYLYESPVKPYTGLHPSIQSIVTQYESAGIGTRIKDLWSKVKQECFKIPEQKILDIVANRQQRVRVDLLVQAMLDIEPDEKRLLRKLMVFDYWCEKNKSVICGYIQKLFERDSIMLK